MLSRINIQSPKDRKTLVESFDPESTTWIVSDLKSKLALQKRLLAVHPILPEECILRASEVWKKIFSRIRPEVRIISQDLAVSLLSEMLDGSEFEWAKTAGAPTKVYEFLALFSAILSHPNGHEKMGDWFRQNVESYIRWGEWFLECQRLWSEFENRRLIPSVWIAGVLSNEEIGSGAWKRNLYLDLGPDLQLVEAEMARQISNRLDVTVVWPSFPQNQAYELLFRPYEVLGSAKDLNRALAPNQKPSVNTARFATMLSEVKDATVQVREWVESGLLPSQIAIVAPDIKVYGRALSHYFVHEGLPLELERTALISDLPAMSRWLAELNFLGNETRSEDLERTLYSAEAEGPLQFDLFRSLYARIYDDEDLARDNKIERLFRDRLVPRDRRMVRDEFIGWALSFYPLNSPLDPVESLIKTIMQECPQTMRLRVRDWVRYVQNRTRRTDMFLERVDSGVQCVNIDSAEDLDAEAVIFLGLSDNDLRHVPSQRVDAREQLSITTQTGLAFPSNDSNRLDFKIRWMMDSLKEVVLSFPSTDFEGNVLAPSLLWIEKRLESGAAIEAIAHPRTTVWDSIQQQGADAIAGARGWTSLKSESLVKRLDTDLGRAEDSPFGADWISRISASSIEDYFTCPFVFAAKRLYKLADLPELDLDADHMTRGKLMHKVFEKLLIAPVQFNRSRPEIEGVIDQAKKEADVSLGDDRVWPVLRSQYADLAERFLEFEKEWRKKFPETETFGREVRIQGFFDPKTKEFSRESSESSVQILGAIDRLDRDRAGNVAIIDYKSSATGVNQFKSWIEKNQLQLGIYTLAYETGLSDLSSGPVVGAFYFVTKDMDRKKGFRLVASGGTLFDLEGREQNKISGEDKARFLNEIREKVAHVIGEARAGKFQPRPLDMKDCKDCEWNQICRAPHLN